MGVLQLTYNPNLKLVHRTGELIPSHKAKSVQLWYSVDPKADNFPSMNPYVYCNQNPIDLIDIKGLYPDPPSMKSMLRIFPYLNQRAAIYVIQEIPKRNEYGQIMHITNPANRTYQKIQINNAQPGYSGKDIYLTEEVSSWDSCTKSPNFVYTYNEVEKPKTYDIAFIQSTDQVTNDANYNKDIMDISNTVKKTGEIISISGATSNTNSNAIIGTTVQGTRKKQSTSGLANDRATKIYNDLLNSGVDQSQLNILPPRSNVPNRNTTITIQKPIDVQGITPTQIKE